MRLEHNDGSPTDYILRMTRRTLPALPESVEVQWHRETYESDVPLSAEAERQITEILADAPRLAAYTASLYEPFLRSDPPSTIRWAMPETGMFPLAWQRTGDERSWRYPLHGVDSLFATVHFGKLCFDFEFPSRCMWDKNSWSLEEVLRRLTPKPMPKMQDIRDPIYALAARVWEHDLHVQHLHAEIATQRAQIAELSAQVEALLQRGATP